LISILRLSISILLAVLFLDHLLGGLLFVPISLHPEVLNGNVITAILKWILDSACQHQHPIRGIVAGCALLLGMLAVSITAAWFCLLLVTAAMMGIDTSGADGMLMSKFLPWFLGFYLVQSVFSLQLMYSVVALQMAHQIARARLS
jgi:hypothetical protein